MKVKDALKEQAKSLLVPVLFLLAIGIVALTVSLIPEEEETAEVIPVSKYEGNGGELVLENDSVKFVLDAETTQFSVTQKDNGTVWYSNPQDADEDPVALPSDIENLKSTLLLTYSTINGVDTLYNNYKYSIAAKNYEIEQGTDFIKVHYSVGEMEKEFMIPKVITEERMLSFMEQMSKTDASNVGDSYKKYDINNLGKKDNREELLEQYPVLETEVIYVLRNGVKDNMKKKLEQYFADAGYTAEDYASDKELDLSESSSSKPVFNISVVYRLEGQDLLVSVPMNDIEYKEDYPLITVNVLPYFGAGTTNEEGYLLVPEGGGSIINFNNGKTAQSSYYSSLYGWDMAQGRDYLVHETRVYYGLFGISKGDSSMLCMLEDGASYAGINADISGRNNSYNFVSANYTLLHREQCDVADKYNGEMFMYEQAIPDETIVQRYRFVDSGSYVDMANVYHDYLEQKYPDAFVKKEDTDVPVAVEILGAVDKVEQICGIPVSRPLALTTYEEAEEMITDLKKSGIEDLSVKLSGWANGGINQKILKKVKLVGRLGSKKDLKNLTSCAAENQVDLYLDGVATYEYDSNLLNGFLVFRDAATFANEKRVKLLPFDKIYYGEQNDQNPYYLLKPEIILQNVENLSKAADTYGGAGISLRDIGYELSADYNQKQLVTRENMKKEQVALLNGIKASGQKIMTNMGNDYTLGVTDFITNMDLNGSGYTILDAAVPFYQIAIHGYVNYAGEALNLTADCEEELLKSAEYGAGLYFSLMDADATELQNTKYTQYFGANYEASKDELFAIYTRYQKELGSVFHQRIVDHAILDSGITLTVYEDGTKVYVNYNYDNVTMDGIEIPARDYLVMP